MIGAIAGDMAGSIYERNSIKHKDFQLFTKGCYFTDDTVLTVALADTIMTGKPYEKNMRRFYSLYPDAGYGGSFQAWARDPYMGPYNSWGNGGAMRASPVGFAFDSLETVLEKAAEFSALTHNHPEGVKGGQAVAASVFLARQGRTRKEIQKYVSETFDYDLSRHVDEIRPGYGFDVSAQGSVPQAVRAFLDSEDYEDALRTAISLGGDSDTQACIAGGIAQAFYHGVPEHIQVKVYGILDDRLASIVREFMDRYC